MTTPPTDRSTDRELPCEHCDDTGDVNGLDGEWRGYCICPAGARLRNVGTTAEEKSAPTTAGFLEQIERSHANVAQLRKIYPGCFDANGQAIVAVAALPVTPKGTT